jgi:prolyl-tRNA synthetase
MRFSASYIPLRKPQPVPDGTAVNHELLTAGGFINQLMAGSYTLLPLGFRVYANIERVVREELAKTGAQELLMPLLHPREVWDQTGRWDKAKDVMFQLKSGNDREFALSFTHEEVLLDLVKGPLQSYKDLPIKLYHFSTKFRQEARAKSGLLRGREFIMKDLYSLHDSKEDFASYFEEVAKAYERIFTRLEIPVKRVEAAGGVFTDEHTLEFQTPCAIGEDTIFECEKCGWTANKEIVETEKITACQKCGGELKELRSIEVGNNFDFGTTYSEKVGAYFSDKNGEKKPAWFGSYGIGMSRSIATMVELHHDEKGIIWPKEAAPYAVHLIDLSSSDKKVREAAEELYDSLQKSGIEVLWDDREVSTGVKFADADLIGIPLRVTVSPKTMEQEKVEVKARTDSEVKLVSADQIKGMAS